MSNRYFRAEESTKITVKVLSLLTVRASILAANPSATPTEIRKALFLRFYEQDFDSATREKVLRSLETV